MKTSYVHMGCISWLIIVLVTILGVIGCVVLYDASEGMYEPWAMKQAMTYLCFGVIAFSLPLVSVRFIYDSAYYVYGLCLVLLVCAVFYGHTAMGAQRWIRIGSIINVQPSEWMKLAIIMALGHYFASIQHHSVAKIKHLLLPLTMVAAPVVLILRQPNLGTALIILFISGAMFFVAGVKIRKFIALFVVIAVCAPFVWKYMLYDYQRQRIAVLFNPDVDPLGRGYNVAQSKIAIGSGGWWGKGIAHGTQSHLKFLPEKHNDFICSIIAEEAGFVGILVIVILYTSLIMLLLLSALTVQDYYGKLVIIGISSMFFVHIFVNLSMISGILPVVGTSLPLLSYGGSHLGMCLVAVGIVLSIRWNGRRKVHADHWLNVSE